jgi:hypothetical protein
LIQRLGPWRETEFRLRLLGIADAHCHDAIDGITPVKAAAIPAQVPAGSDFVDSLGGHNHQRLSAVSKIVISHTRKSIREISAI